MVSSIRKPSLCSFSVIETVYLSQSGTTTYLPQLLSNSSQTAITMHLSNLFALFAYAVAASALSVPTVPAPASLPATSALPTLPGLPGVKLPAVSDLPIPPVPGASTVPGVPTVPGAPAVPGAPTVPGAPAVPGVPDATEISQAIGVLQISLALINGVEIPGLGAFGVGTSLVPTLLTTACNLIKV